MSIFYLKRKFEEKNPPNFVIDLNKNYRKKKTES